MGFCAPVDCTSEDFQPLIDAMKLMMQQQEGMEKAEPVVFFEDTDTPTASTGQIIGFVGFSLFAILFILGLIVEFTTF